MKIEVGKYYRCVYGDKIYIAGETPFNEMYPFIAVSETGVNIALLTADGKLYDDIESESDWDVIEEIKPKRKLTGWMNIYREGIKGFIHENKVLADNHANNRIACIDLSKYNIEYEDGEGR